MANNSGEYAGTRFLFGLTITSLMLLVAIYFISSMYGQPYDVYYPGEFLFHGAVTVVFLFFTVVAIVWESIYS